MSRNRTILASLAGACLATTTLAQAQEVTYQDILDNPGDVDLNLAYAQQQIDAGNLVAASAALERLLFIEPNWDEARLLYAGVLYRLGDYEAAKREMDLLEGRELSPAAADEITRYRSRVNNAVMKTRVGGRVAIGYGYDENANSLVSEDAIAETSIDESSFTASGSLRIAHDISDAKDLTIFAQGDAYTKQFDDAGFDGYTIYGVKAGLMSEGANFDWQLNADSRNVRIDGEGYLTEYGVQGIIAKDLGARTIIGARASYYDQDYSTVYGFTDDNADDRSGDRTDYSLFIRQAFSSSFTGSAVVSYRDKTADGDQNFAYTYTGGQLTGDILLGGGFYIGGDLVYRDYEYDGSFGREDEYQYGRVALGLPVSGLIPPAKGSVADDLLIEIAAYTADRNSNIDVFDYEGTGAEARLIWRFGQ